MLRAVCHGSTCGRIRPCLTGRAAAASCRRLAARSFFLEFEFNGLLPPKANTPRSSLAFRGSAAADSPQASAARNVKEGSENAVKLDRRARPCKVMVSADRANRVPVAGRVRGQASRLL